MSSFFGTEQNNVIMKILKNQVEIQEKLDGTFPKMVECTSCKSQLEIESKDVSIHAGYWGVDTRVYTCPCCKHVSAIVEI